MRIRISAWVAGPWRGMPDDGDCPWCRRDWLEAISHEPSFCIVGFARCAEIIIDNKTFLLYKTRPKQKTEDRGQKNNY